MLLSGACPVNMQNVLTSAYL